MCDSETEEGGAGVFGRDGTVEIEDEGGGGDGRHRGRGGNQSKVSKKEKKREERKGAEQFSEGEHKVYNLRR